MADINRLVVRKKSNCKMAVAAISFVIVLVFANFAESRVISERSLMLSEILEDSFPQLDNGKQEYNKLDYDYVGSSAPMPALRRRRWAFPVEIQNSRCPPGHKMHSSGLRCVPIEDEGDDY